MVNFLRGHQYSLFLWREHAKLELLLPGDTRFATNFIMSGQLGKEEAASGEVVADRRYMQWLDGTLEGLKKGKKKYHTEGIWVKNKINDPKFWEMNKLILTVVDPIVELLRLGDSELPIMGKVYNRMYLIQEKLADSTFAPALKGAQRKEIAQIHKDRWEYLHNHYHAAGYALDPEFVDREQHKEAEVMTGLRAVIARIYHNQPDKAAKARQQYLVYKNRTQGTFGDTSIWADAEAMPAHEWWELYGGEIPELQYIAMKVLSKRSSACSVERLWSLFGLVWADARASLGPKKAIDLVKAGSNLRLLRKLSNMNYEVTMRGWVNDDGEQIANESDDEDY